MPRAVYKLDDPEIVEALDALLRTPHNRLTRKSLATVYRELPSS
jgi:hypothetical protein